MASCTGWWCPLANQVDVFANIAKNVVQVRSFVLAMSYLMGIAFGMKAIMTLKELAESRGAMSGKGNLKEPIIYFLVCGMLLYLPSGFKALMLSTFGYSNVLAYAPVNSNNSLITAMFGQNSPIAHSLVTIIQLIGLIAFVRGWVLISRSASQGQQPGGMGKGFTHVFGGILAMNIIGTLHMINNTLYGG